MQAYIVSKTDLKVKDFATLTSFEINEDSAADVPSGFGFAHPPLAVIGDFILLQNLYLGVISGMETDKKMSSVILRSLPILSIFSRNILLGSPDSVTENYITSAMQDNFANSGDALSDISYLAVTANTQTSLGITPHNENGIYNLNTFLRYAAIRHQIFTNFTLTPNTLSVSVEYRIPPLRVIDATVADVLSLNETIVSECVSKVTVKTSSSVITYYLFDNGIFGTDPNSGTRLAGKVDTVYCENPSDAAKTAADIFAKNQYSHLIEMEIVSGSKIYDTATMQLYDRALIRTRSGVYNSYIGFKGQRSTAKSVLFKFGDARLALTDKLKGGI